MTKSSSSHAVVTPPVQSTVMDRLINSIACPDETMDEIASTPTSARLWIIPTLIACLTAFLCLASDQNDLSDDIRANRNLAQLLAIISSSFLGMFWSAFVLWLIGRWALQSCFSYAKALEVIAATATVVALSSIFTLFLAQATGIATAEPALSLLLSEFNPALKSHRMLASFNLFHLWSTYLLALGLARITKATLSECAFWVFGYWTVLHAVLS